MMKFGLIKTVQSANKIFVQHAGLGQVRGCFRPSSACPSFYQVCPMLLKCITRYISIKMQLTSVVALLSSLAFAAANPPGYGRPAAYAQASVPWTSSTCSAVYSTTTITSSKPVTSVVTTTTYKPSTYTTSSPTVISSVTTVYRPKTTSVVSTITTTTVGKSEEHLKHDAKHDTYIS